MMWLWMMLSAFAGVVGWRNDGTNVYAQAAPIQSFDTTNHAVWSTSLGSWGNASPVVVGGRVCATAEPTMLACVDASTGRLLWKGTNEVVDTFAADVQPAIRAQIADAEAAEARLREARKQYSTVQKESRRAPDDAALAQQVQSLAIEMESLKARVEAVSWYRTPADREIIGYASATPVTDGTYLYALFGNGVLSAWTLDGRKVWTRWLGPHRVQMRGYTVGTAASPLLAEGHLIVPWDWLLAVHPATGETVWDGGTWLDYGTPAVTRVGSTTVLLTPDGRMVRVRDGTVLQTGLGNIWYIGPVVHGSEVYYVGSTSDGHTTQRSGVAVATGLRLTETAPGVVRAEQRWHKVLQTTHTFYAQPVVHGNRLYMPTQRGEIRVLDTADGREVYVHDATADLFSDVFTSPVIAGGTILYIGATGFVVVTSIGDTWTSPYLNRLGVDVRSTPVIVGDRAFLRTERALVCLTTGA